MIFWHRRAAKSPPSEKKANPRFLELQEAKEIVAEIFQARPSDIEDMIKRRLHESSWAVKQMPTSAGLWAVAFSLVSSHGQELQEREDGCEKELSRG